MSSGNADRNLLVGILAYQLAFISKDQLVAGMQAWLYDKARPLSDILHDRGALDEPRRALLDALVNQHVQQHGGDPHQSLQAISSAASLRRDLERLHDPDLQASLAFLSDPLGRGGGGDGEPGSDPSATISQAAGAATSAGTRFRILRPHAKGGLGEVYVALDTELNREVALKEMQGKHADNLDSRARFLLEAEITGGLEHPSIVPVYGLGTYADGRPFYAMRFIRGDSLQDAIKRFHLPSPSGRGAGGEGDAPNAKSIDRALELRKLLGRLIDVCNALQYAHDRGVLHRDIKPGNIMLGKYGETLVVDWGLAKAVGRAVPRERPGEEPTLIPSSASGSAETIAGSAIGTPAYMSPEQAEGRLDLLGPASDVYSLGATLYALLTGKSPVDGSLEQVLKKVRSGDISPPRRLDPTIDAAVEAICLKAMSLRPADRYASPQALADDLERWVAGEPVSTYREPLVKRLGRWRRRHNTLVTASTLMLVTLVLSVIVGFGVLRRGQAEARVLGQVDGLQDAAVGAVPTLLANLATRQAAAGPKLRARWADAALTDRQRLRIGLALADDAEVRRRLIELAQRAEDPREVLLVRDALLPLADVTNVELWERVQKRALSRVERFRLLAMLATLDPNGAGWTESAEPTAEALFGLNPLHLGVWQPALAPVRDKLLATLVNAYRDNAVERRNLAAALLADYASDQRRLLADLVMDADEQQFAVIYPVAKSTCGSLLSAMMSAEINKQPKVVEDKQILVSNGTSAEFDAIVRTHDLALSAKRYEVRLQARRTYHLTMDSQDFQSALVLQEKSGKELAYGEKDGGKLSSSLVYTCFHSDNFTVFAASRKGTGAFVFKIVEIVDADDAKEKLAKRQANAAVVLLRMNQPEKVWPLLKHRADPRVRSYLIHRFGPLGADVEAIVKRFDDERDLSIRRALILSLGEYTDKDWPADKRVVMTKSLQKIYQSVSDPGLHASAEWLLRTWKQEAWLKQVNDAWAKDKAHLEKACRTALAPGAMPQWYVNGQGQTMVVIPGPVEFVMGSPTTEKDRIDNERQHKKRLGRTFAVAAKAVTVEQYRQFDKTYTLAAKYTRTADLPVVGTSWYQAAEYCNWLSKQEGIDKGQWCYEANLIGQISNLKANYLSLTGYRLPTEAEMEYVTRAGAATARYYGETDELLGKYAWYAKSSQDMTWPVASLKPNDLGFFDVHGNAYTWCQESYKSYTDRINALVADKEDGLAVVSTSNRVLRGGTFTLPSSGVRSAERNLAVPSNRSIILGFRPARTLQVD